MSRSKKIQEFDPNGVGLQNGHFIGLPFEEEEAQVVLLSVPWDVTVSFAEGTSRGPENILQASTQLDLYDPWFPDAWKNGLYMRPSDPAWQARNNKLRAQARQYISFLEQGGQVAENEEMARNLSELNQACDELRQWVKSQTQELMARGKAVGVVGGEHSVPLGYLQALSEAHENFGVLQIDAHLDLRKAYEGFSYSHASIFHNALQLPQLGQLVAVGIRDFCHEEVERIKTEGDRVQVFYDHVIQEKLFRGETWNHLCGRMVASLPEDVYVSFDIDGLCPELCPHTGTPVPGGLSYNRALHLLKVLVESGRRIIGFDLCEVAGTDHDWDGNVGARLLYRLANLMFHSSS
jgi:agmatinase